MKKKSILKAFKSTKEMDTLLEYEDLGDYFVRYGKIQKPLIKKINIDLPEWLIKDLDIEAKRAGVARQPLVKLWLVQKLEEERKKRVF
jgi:hypothetical protein